MASGRPYVKSIGDAFLFDLLSRDSLLQRYLPGGVFGTKPNTGAIQPIRRFWQQSPGTDRPRQDGRLGRVWSEPTYIVCGLDRQQSSADLIYGTLGSKLRPPQPYLHLAQTRIYDLLHGQVFESGGFRFAPNCFTEYTAEEDVEQGWRDAMVGWWVRMPVL